MEAGRQKGSEAYGAATAKEGAFDGFTSAIVHAPRAHQAGSVRRSHCRGLCGLNKSAAARSALNTGSRPGIIAAVCLEKQRLRWPAFECHRSRPLSLRRLRGFGLVTAVAALAVFIWHGNALAPLVAVHDRARRLLLGAAGACRAFAFGLELGSFMPACSARRRSIIRLEDSTDVPAIADQEGFDLTFVVPTAWLMTGRFTPLAVIGVYLVHGFAQLFMTFNIAHDANHGAYSKSKPVNRVSASSSIFAAGAPTCGA